MSEGFKKNIVDWLEVGLKRMEAPITSVPITDKKILALPNHIILKMLEKTKKMEEEGSGNESFILALEIEIKKFKKEEN